LQACAGVEALADEAFGFGGCGGQRCGVVGDAAKRRELGFVGALSGGVGDDGKNPRKCLLFFIG